MKAQPPHDNLQRPDDSPVARFRRADDPEWHWLENRDDPEVIAFLEAANRESASWFAPLDELVERSRPPGSP